MPAKYPLSFFDRMTFLLVCLFSFFAISKPGISMVIAGILLIVFMIDRTATFRFAKQDKFHWLLLACIILPIITWGWGYLTQAPWQADYPKAVEVLVKYLLFVFIAFFIRNSLTMVILFWLSFSLGLLLSPFVSGEGLQEISALLNGQRVKFGIRNEQHLALAAAMVLLFSLTVLLRLWNVGTGFINLKRVAIVFVIGASLWITLASQTRGVWLGLFACLLAGAVAILISIKQAKARVLLITGLISFLVVVVYYDSQVSKRLVRVIDTLEQITTLELSQVELSSGGIRLHMWSAGWQAFEQSPLLGQGYHGGKLAIKSAPYLTAAMKQEYFHLHNSYIDMLARYGVLGLTWYLLLVGTLSLGVYRAYQARQMTRSVYQFYWGFLILWSVANFFESYLFMSIGPMFFLVVMAGVYSYRYRPDGQTDLIANHTGSAGQIPSTT